MLLGDVDSADNEDETDSETHIQTKSNYHCHNHDKVLQKYHSHENSKSNDKVIPHLECGKSNGTTSNCYSNNFHSALRPNQLFRNRIKHETKL